MALTELAVKETTRELKRSLPPKCFDMVYDVGKEINPCVNNESQEFTSLIPELVRSWGNIRVEVGEIGFLL